MIRRLTHRLRGSEPPAPDVQVNQDLAAWRAGTAEGALADTVAFQPGLTLHADPALGLSGTYRSPLDRLLELETKMSGDGAWLGLHLGLPLRDLSGFGVVGFAARTSAGSMALIRACLRSGLDEGGFQDVFFDKHLLTRPEESAHLDALHLPQVPDVALQAPWRELVFFLPTQDCHLSLIDLRVFTV